MDVKTYFEMAEVGLKHWPFGACRYLLAHRAKTEEVYEIRAPIRDQFDKLEGKWRSKLPPCSIIFNDCMYTLECPYSRPVATPCCQSELTSKRVYSFGAGDSGWILRASIMLR